MKRGCLVGALIVINSLLLLSPARSQGVLRIGMTASDVPTTTGMPNNGFEGMRFLGYPAFEGLVLWDLFGDLPLPLGVAGHEGSTVIVGLNGLRLLREAAWRRPTPSPWGLWRGGRVGTPVSARMRGPSR